MASHRRQQRQIDTTASPGFTRAYLIALGTAAVVGLVIGIIWVIAGLLHFHPLW